MMPPEAGSAVTLVDIQTADDYAIWTPNPGGGAYPERLSLTNLMSFGGGLNPGAPSLVLNVPGSTWPAGSSLILWPYSGGQPNEVWWFQPVSVGV
jgi:hypothetical protein